MQIVRVLFDCRTCAKSHSSDASGSRDDFLEASPGGNVICSKAHTVCFGAVHSLYSSRDFAVQSVETSIARVSNFFPRQGRWLPLTGGLQNFFFFPFLSLFSWHQYMWAQRSHTAV